MKPELEKQVEREMAKHPMQSSIEKTLQGYTNFNYLTEGGQAAVFQCEKDGKKYAGKILKFANNDWKDRDTFRRQTELMGKKIKGLPEIYEAYFDEDVFYPVVVTELIKGENLCNRLDVDTKKYSVKLLKLIESVHSKGLVLRDINTKNLMINEDGELFYVDTSSILMPYQDHTMTAVGQANYFAPEEMNNINYKFETEQEKKEFRENLPYLTDLYKVGLVMKELYHGKSLKDIKGHPVSRDLKLEGIIDKLTSEHPANRISVKEILKNLKNDKEAYFENIKEVSSEENVETFTNLIFGFGLGIFSLVGTMAYVCETTNDAFSGGLYGSAAFFSTGYLGSKIKEIIKKI